MSPIESDSLFNCGIEIPSAADARISLVSDVDTRSELAFPRCVDRVRKCSWGDHVVIATIANNYVECNNQGSPCNTIW